MFNKTLDYFCLRHWLHRNINDLEKAAESLSDLSLITENCIVVYKELLYALCELTLCMIFPVEKEIQL